jgi:hypothetical protein
MSIQEDYERFNQDNPHVIETLEKMATRWLERHQKVGVKMLVEALRWNTGFRTEGDPDFKLNDKYTSRYARELLRRHPEWQGRIDTRQLRAVSA